MFEQVLKVTRQLSAADRDTLIVRLDRVGTISHNLGYGVGDAMDSLPANYIGTRPPFGSWFTLAQTCFASLPKTHVTPSNGETRHTSAACERKY
jgi:hypothetical protein